MLWPQQLLRCPDLHVGREVPIAQGFSKLERMCFTVESGDQHDSPRELLSLQKWPYLALDRQLRGLEVQVRVTRRCTWCPGKPKAVSKDP